LSPAKIGIGAAVHSTADGLIGGVSPTNILRHEPLSRNPLLVDALTANRSNLGVRWKSR
jgi:ATP-dependent DNA helicase RecG